MQMAALQAPSFKRCSSTCTAQVNWLVIELLECECVDYHQLFLIFWKWKIEMWMPACVQHHLWSIWPTHWHVSWIFACLRFSFMSDSFILEQYWLPELSILVNQLNGTAMLPIIQFWRDTTKWLPRVSNRYCWMAVKYSRCHYTRLAHDQEATCYSKIEDYYYLMLLCVVKCY